MNVWDLGDGGGQKNYFGFFGDMSKISKDHDEIYNVAHQGSSNRDLLTLPLDE